MTILLTFPNSTCYSINSHLFCHVIFHLLSAKLRGSSTSFQKLQHVTQPGYMGLVFFLSFSHKPLKFSYKPPLYFGRPDLSYVLPDSPRGCTAMCPMLPVTVLIQRGYWKCRLVGNLHIYTSRVLFVHSSRLMGSHHQSLCNTFAYSSVSVLVFLQGGVEQNLIIVDPPYP